MLRGVWDLRRFQTTLVAAVTSAAARSNACWFADEGFAEPLTLRTYCSAAAPISSGVAGGAKLCRTLILRHMSSR